MSDKTIPADKIKKLIEDYWGYESDCMSGDYNKVAAGRAALYRTVISDLEELVPRKTLADVPWGERINYVGMWAEGPEFKVSGQLFVIAAINHYSTQSVIVVHPNIKATSSEFSADSVIPREDIPRAWTPNGQPGERL